MWYQFVKVVFSVLFRILFRLDVYGKENIPKEGPVVIACNHVSNLDPPMVGTAATRTIHFMAKSELFDSFMGKVYASLYAFPVHRGKADTQAIRKALTILKNKQVLGIFPEGHRVTTGKLDKAEPGAMAIAIKGKALVVPTAIMGSNLKARKSFWPHIKVIFGKPISVHDESGNKKETEALSEELMREIGLLIEAHKDA
ncbi:MAG: 1-acyl-sn-glycerol-3-phosphate acyltransferase [Acidaminococcus sp.]|jgi:1-acyl-sn-glycerol-3-phosphate acyltransferase|nr:1-acyl-sn-glycerol-3-phosphate acyltransferase [Acidaminococcus sp.]MCI2099462.1 1-acyl-sn-glycerol-3-phosphate acyltransferase [Acidaminococcus sp.]MCI2113822.1 1-acyl-sn-glycerol-3-phosphate acyltransferase [Acidaminococcus sp.]MCI2115604.1 1-acyl-sn-glycerol-3-phosphate acyltransferase [Acidaminococcus sp.]